MNKTHQLIFGHCGFLKIFKNTTLQQVKNLVRAKTLTDTRMIPDFKIKKKKILTKIHMKNMDSDKIQ